MTAMASNTERRFELEASAPGWREDAKLAAVLGGATAIAIAAVFPYLLQVMPDAFAKLPLPLALIVPLQSLQSGLLVGLLAFAGLRMSSRARLELPWLRAWMAGQPLPKFPWRLSAAIGVVTALAIVALSLLTDPWLPTPLDVAATPPAASALAGFLASFYGGIGEEIQLRLFLMTAVVWVMARIGRRAPTSTHYWVGIAIAALLFGAGHLPAAAQIWPLDASVVVRTLLLNGVAGLAFGWLYWKRGLETAMVAHFCADLVLHVAAPVVGSMFG